ncbi:hypothetical protein P4O66_022774, partial [Electrophorus voltai]
QERIALKDSDSPCKGRLEVYHQNQWGLIGFHEWHNKNGPITLTLNHNGKNNTCAGVVQFQVPPFIVSVCNRDWDESRADMVCREHQCGRYHKIPKTGTFHVDRASHYVPLSCVGGESFSWQCVNWVSPRPNTCHEEAGVICSEHVSVRLHGGADVCNGTLEEYNSTESSWAPVKYTEDIYKRAEDICSMLMCGKSVSVKPYNETNNIWLTCSGKQAYTGQFKGTVLETLTVVNYKVKAVESILSIIRFKLLFSTPRLSDRINVELVRAQRPSQCHGEIYVRVNGSGRAVCFDGMDAEEHRKTGDVVCRELRCGKLLEASEGNGAERGLLSHVDCHGNEGSLWECLRKHNTGPFCKTIKVTCADSLDVRLEDGLDRCAGRLEVRFEGSWWRATDWSNDNSDVVCRHLNCGKSFITEENIFVNGKLPVLKWKMHCENASTPMSQCFWNKTDSQLALKNTVDIICTRAEIWFLQGNSSCEGRVNVEAAGKSRLLTTEDTWNNETAAKVCKRLLCGGVRSFTPESSARHDSDSRNCSADTCPKEISVSCSGSMEVRLENNKKERCWGKLEVCTGGKCGGVCRVTWKQSYSKTLCRHLGCGDVMGEFDGPLDSNVTVGSVHCPESAQNLSQCNFVFMSDASDCQTPAYIACAGARSAKAALLHHRDECAGRAEIFHLGQWRPLCKIVSKQTQNALCTSVGCGESVSVEADGSNALGLLHVTCRDSNISNCDFPRAKVQECALGHLTCANWSRLLLTSPVSACAGSVFMLSGGFLHTLSNQSWAEQDSASLCNNLQCGTNGTATVDLMHRLLWERSHKCSKKVGGIWDCELKGHRQSSMNRQHLKITCKDEPSVSLLENCKGQIRINQSIGVCKDSQRTEGVFRELCQQLGCGTYLSSWATSREGPVLQFRCTGLENRLWQCSSRPAECSQVISVACSESIEFQFAGKCGGELQVRYRGSWEPVCTLRLEDAHVICQELECGKALDSKAGTSSGTRIDASFSCGHQQLPRHCVQAGSSCREGPATIICEKFSLEEKSFLTVGLSVGLGLMLVSMAIVFWQQKRLIHILRLRPPGRDVEINGDEISRVFKLDLPGRKSSAYEMENYDYVDPSRSPEEDSESESRGEDENDSSSGDSYGTDYDDVDEANVKPLLAGRNGPATPLLPPRPANLTGEEAYEGKLDVKEDDDDVMAAHTVVGGGERAPSPPGPVAGAAVVGPDDQTQPQGAREQK